MKGIWLVYSRWVRGESAMMWLALGEVGIIMYLSTMYDFFSGWTCPGDITKGLSRPTICLHELHRLLVENN